MEGEILMKNQKRHSSFERNLIVWIILAIIVFATLLYLYHNYWNGHFIIDGIPTSIVGICIIFIIPSLFCTIFVLVAILLSVRFPIHSKNEQQIEKLSDTFEQVKFNDFNNFTLSSLVSNEDVECFAKKDKNGKITIKIFLTHQIDKHELFLKHFKI